MFHKFSILKLISNYRNQLLELNMVKKLLLKMWSNKL